MTLFDNECIKNSENPLADFERIAEQILNESILVVNQKKYRICSIEFYYSHLKHSDKAAHRHRRLDYR